MDLIMDVMLLTASLAAAIYCRVLSAKLRRFTALETGMGGAIAVLSAQVDEMKGALAAAKGVAGGTEARLEALCAKGEASARRLELMIASLHDLPDTGQNQSQTREMRPDMRANPVSPVAPNRNRAGVEPPLPESPLAPLSSPPAPARPRFFRRKTQQPVSEGVE